VTGPITSAILLAGVAVATIVLLRPAEETVPVAQEEEIARV
jgi:hypothetical protein